VKQESLFWWIASESPNRPLVYYGHYDNAFTKTNHASIYSAFTVAELGEMLPFNGWTGWVYEDYDGKRGFTCKVSKCPCEVETCKANELSENFEYADTEADVRPTMPIYLLENKLLP
jgi:hypothetical protein